jgi:outer membrane protein assembly factor BamB
LPTTLWRYYLGGGSACGESSAAVDADGTVYVGALVALDGVTGAVKWTFAALGGGVAD